MVQPGQRVQVEPGHEVTIAPDGRVMVVPLAKKAPEPVRLGLLYAHTFSSSGELVDSRETANTLGLEFSFHGGRVVRQHLALAHRWERSGATSRKGFRFDLLALGFPMLVARGPVTFEIEPMLRLFRGDIMFEATGGAKSHVLFRIESGAAVRLTVGMAGWFLAAEPVAVDFRYFTATADASRGGFATLWSFALVAGREL